MGIIPYRIQNKIVHRIIDIFMIVTLLATLFPIGWMVYCSFKSNTEVLLGKIPLGRAGNDIIQIQVEDKYLWALSADGGINKFDREGVLKDHVSTKSLATYFLSQPGYIWVSTSDRGLIRIDKENLHGQKKFKLPFKGVDVSKVVATFLLRDGDRLWVGLHHRGIQDIAEFDLVNLRFIRVLDLANDLSPFEILCLAKSRGFLWVGTNKGLLKVDPQAGRVVRFFSGRDLGLLSPHLRHVIPWTEEKLYLGTLGGVYEFNTSLEKVEKRFSEKEGIISNRIEQLLVDEKNLYIGTNLGLSVVDRETGRIRNYEALFASRRDTRKIDPSKLTASNVYALAKEGNILYMGASGGRVSTLDLGVGRVQHMLLSKEGHIIVRWRNYVDLWKNIDFGLYLRNSFVVCGATMLLAMVFATLAAYSLSRFRFPGANLFGMSILATQMIPAIMLLIPIYIMFVKFTALTGIAVKGTYWGLILIYSAFFIPFSIWILRGFFAAIPPELEEAARIDGCSPLQVFWHIALPLVIPGIIATGIYVFLTAWDELMFAWVLTSAHTLTVPVGIRLFVGNYQNRFDLMMAAATVATVPVMILFFMLQRHIVKGLTAGAVKG